MANRRTYRGLDANLRHDVDVVRSDQRIAVRFHIAVRTDFEHDRVRIDGQPAMLLLPVNAVRVAQEMLHVRIELDIPDGTRMLLGCSKRTG